jgi:peptidoglycan-associated lipoprotein
MVIMITLAFCFSLVWVTGCAKKAVVKEEATVTQEQKAAPKAAAKTTDADAEAARLRALKEQADREAAMKKAAAAEKAPYEFADVYFDFDKYTLKAEARETLKKHGEWLTKNGDFSVVVEGNCDERGTAEYNLALGERRAQEAKKYLVGVGIADKRISTVSYGKERPVDPGHTEEAWAKNRRDHFVVTRKK